MVNNPSLIGKVRFARDSTKISPSGQQPLRTNVDKSEPRVRFRSRLDPASKVTGPREGATPQWSNIFGHCGLVSVAPNRPKRSCRRSSLRTFSGSATFPGSRVTCATEEEAASQLPSSHGIAKNPGVAPVF
jgi:hypothetical protein